MKNCNKVAVFVRRCKDACADCCRRREELIAALYAFINRQLKASRSALTRQWHDTGTWFFSWTFSIVWSNNAIWGRGTLRTSVMSTPRRRHWCRTWLWRWWQNAREPHRHRVAFKYMAIDGTQTCETATGNGEETFGCCEGRWLFWRTLTILKDADCSEFWRTMTVPRDADCSEGRCLL